MRTHPVLLIMLAVLSFGLLLHSRQSDEIPTEYEIKSDLVGGSIEADEPISEPESYPYLEEVRQINSERFIVGMMTGLEAGFNFGKAGITKDEALQIIRSVINKNGMTNSVLDSWENFNNYMDRSKK